VFCLSCLLRRHNHIWVWLKLIHWWGSPFIDIFAVRLVVSSSEGSTMFWLSYSGVVLDVACSPWWWDLKWVWWCWGGKMEVVVFGFGVIWLMPCVIGFL
jgi:hypothetical protein